MNFNIIIKKLDRIISWILFVFFLTFMVSGYMITRGLISPYWGSIIHTEYDLYIMLLFSIHIAINFRFLLMRRGVKSGLLVNSLCLLLGAIPFLFMLYLDMFYLRGGFSFI